MLGMTYAGDLSPQQAWDLISSDPNAVLVDVRTAAEWNWVGVPDLSLQGRNAAFVEWVSYPSGEHNSDFVHQVIEAGAQHDAPVLFLCRSGGRSVAAAQALAAAGFTKAYNISNGFEGDVDARGHRGSQGWRAAGLPWKQS